MNKFLKDMVSRINNPKFDLDFRAALLNPESAICKDFMNLVTKKMLEEQALFLVQAIQFCVAQHLISLERAVILDKKAAENEIEQKEILRHHAIAPVVSQPTSKLSPSILAIMSGALPENIVDLTTQVSQLTAALAEVNKAKQAIKDSWKDVSKRHQAAILQDFNQRGVQLRRNDGSVVNPTDMAVIITNAVSPVDPVTLLEKVVASHTLAGNKDAIPQADICYKVSNIHEELKVLAQLGGVNGELGTGPAILQAMRNNKKNCQINPFNEKQEVIGNAVALTTNGKVLENAIQVREAKIAELTPEKTADKISSPFNIPNPSDTPKLTRDK